MTPKNSSKDSPFEFVGKPNPINEPKAEAKSEAKPAPELNETVWKIIVSFASRTYFLPKGQKFNYRKRNGRYIELSEQLLQKRLSAEGFFTRIFEACGEEENMKKVRARVWSQFIDYVIEHNEIDWAGRLAGIPTGLFIDNDYRCLITRGPTYIIPKEGDCSWIDRFMDELFPGYQRHIIEALMVRMYRQKNDPDSPFICQIPIMVGAKDCGKSLFKDEIFVPLLGGRSADAISFISGGTFNGELGPADVCVIDDQGFFTRFDQDVTADRLKKFAADRNKRIEAKGKEAINVHSKPAMLVMLNTGSKNLRLLPDLSDDIQDKLLGFLCGQATVPKGEGHEKVIRAIIKEQLPAYMFKLLNKLETPPGVISEGRFGIVPFFHPELVRAREEVDSAITVLELITQLAVEKNKPNWTVSPTELFQHLTDNLAGLRTRDALLSVCKTPQALGGHLSRLARTRAERVRKEPRSKFGMQYTIITEIPETESEKPRVFNISSLS
jgi:hypothetical protein